MTVLSKFRHLLRTSVRTLQTSQVPAVSKLSQGKDLLTKQGSRSWCVEEGPFPGRRTSRLVTSTGPKSELLVNAEKSMKKGKVSCPWLPLPEKFELMKITQSKDHRSPIVLVLGWAGANHKNLQKYSQIYQNLGCTTAALTLPTPSL